MFGEEELPKKKKAYELGQAIDDLSVGDLAEAIEMLETELLRLRAAKDGKSYYLNAAEALFRKS